MTAVKLKLAPGFYKNGTEYQAAGRWLDGNLVRWDSDTVRTINGWQRRTDLVTNVAMPPLWGSADPELTNGLIDDISVEPITDEISGEVLTDGPPIIFTAPPVDEAARSGIVLTNAVGNVTTFIGTNNKIYMITNSNVVSDVTPAGFVGQERQAIYASGYGLFRYGYGRYGTPRPTVASNPKHAFSWGFSDWGSWPLACARGVPGEKIKVKRDIDTDFVDIANSPAGTFDMLVTDERFVMTFGNQTDFRRVQWSDQENFDLWAPAVDNQAGGKTLAGIGHLVCAQRCLKNILVLSETDAFIGVYVGPPYVYGFTRVGTQCGIVGPEAISVTDTFAVWIGDKNFWLYDGTLHQLPCDILDFYLKDHDRQQRSKTSSFTNSDYSEVWWLYQSKNSATTEPDSYIIYNHAKKVWYCGRINRTMGIDNDPLIYPFMVDPTGKLYDHEVPSAGYDGAVPFIVSGPLEMEGGKRLLGVQYVYPDAQMAGDVRMELQCRSLPNSPNYFSRDFELLPPTSTMGIMAHDIRMKLYSSGINPNWTIGDFRVLPVKGVTPQR